MDEVENEIKTLPIMVERAIERGQQFGFHLAINQVAAILGAEAEAAINAADQRSLALLQRILQQVSEIAGSVEPDAE